MNLRKKFIQLKLNLQRLFHHKKGPDTNFRVIKIDGKDVFVREQDIERQEAYRKEMGLAPLVFSEADLPGKKRSIFVGGEIPVVKHISPLLDYTGYSQSSRNEVFAMASAGIPLTLEPVVLEDSRQYKAPRWLQKLLEKKDENYDIAIIHLTPDHINTRVPLHVNKYYVARFYWETDKLPKEFVWYVNRTDEVWAFDETRKEQFIKAGIRVPIYVIPACVRPPSVGALERASFDEESRPSEYVFYSIFQWCYDKETRVLTKDGFKYFRDLTYDDELATLNKGTEQLEYQKPTEIVSFARKGKMLKVDNRAFDMLITPNHRLLVKYSKKDRWELIPAKDLLRKDKMKFSGTFRTKKDCKWQGKSLDFFFPPMVEHKQGKDVSVEKIPMSKFLRFFGWYLSEGSCHIAKRGYRVEITQMKDQKYRDEIRRSIVDIGFRPIVRDKYILFYSKQMCLYLKQFGHAKEKYIPSWIKGLSSELLMIFLTSLFKGDGSFWDKKTNYWMKYSTGSKRLAEDVLECLIKVGMSGSISGHEAQSPHYPERKGIGYTVSVNSRKLEPRLCTSSPEYVDYEGNVYCASVPNGTLLVERNGKVIWSGNSERKNMRALLRAYWREFDKDDKVLLCLKTYEANFSGEAKRKVLREFHRWRHEEHLSYYPPVFIYLDYLKSGEIINFHLMGDCYVSPSRGEGWNVPLGTALQLGNAVIYTSSGGIADYLPKMLSHKMISCFGMEWIPWYTYDQKWCEVNLKDLRRKMRKYYRNPKLGYQNGLELQKIVREKFSARAVGEQIKDRIAGIRKEMNHGP